MMDAGAPSHFQQGIDGNQPGLVRVETKMNLVSLPESTSWKPALNHVVDSHGAYAVLSFWSGGSFSEKQAAVFGKKCLLVQRLLPTDSDIPLLMQ